MKIKRLLLVLASAAVLTTACGPNDPAGKEDSKEISVVSREEGSGTRSAFVELSGLLLKDGDEKIDQTTEEAIIQMQTETVIQTVEADTSAIGYISTGSLSDRVKALKIDGKEPDQESIKSGDYKISRPFILVTKEESPLVDDFLSFILSKEGQAIIGKDYIPYLDGEAYQTSNMEGKIVVAGSTSVSPVMEKLAEAYMKLNKVDIEIQQTGSSAGITSTLEGTADLGMSSRQLDMEEEAKLNPTVIALDGIAVIVNKDNPVDGLSLDQVKNIFLGELTDWNEI